MTNNPDSSSTSSQQQKRALVCGAGGFIGTHLVARLKAEGFWVRGADLRYPSFSETVADEFVIGDLRSADYCAAIMDSGFDEIYQLAADMGGAGYIFTGENDADIMHNSALINLNVLNAMRKARCSRVFYSSSACIYPQYNQLDPDNPVLSEDSAYPADPDSEYGWEKLFSERLYLAYAQNHGLEVSIGRYHNVFGPHNEWQGGREKVPAALCRKVIEAEDEIEVWGDGSQTRSFLYVDDCVEATLRLMRSDFAGPVNIGSEEMVSIDQLANTIIEISGKNLTIKHVEGPQGVRGRKSDNRLIEKRLSWHPRVSLRSGLELTYGWIQSSMKH